MADSVNNIYVNIINKVKNSKALERARSNVKKFNEQIKKNEGRFQGWALSIMFFGMAINRALGQVWKSATRTFNDVMHSTEGTVTQFDMLQGSLKFLQFAAGSALEPLVEQLIPLIDRLTDIVLTNDNLVRGFVKWGFVLGTTLTLVGTLTLGFNGLTSAIKNLGVVAAFVFSGLKVAFTKLSHWIVTSSASIGLLTESWALMGTAARLSFLSMIGGIVLAIAWIFKLIKILGGLGPFLQSLGRGLLRVFVLIGEGIATVSTGIVNGVIFALNKTISLINTVIRQINKIPGMNIGMVGEIGKVNYDPGTLFDKYMDFETKKLAPEQGYMSGREIVGATFNIQSMTVEANNTEQILQELQNQTGSNFTG